MPSFPAARLLGRGAEDVSDIVWVACKGGVVGLHGPLLDLPEEIMDVIGFLGSCLVKCLQDVQ